jgi:aspartyl-tRNA(Asn)/glutamyl-tRNA(Gln) amidotransferase subunit C
MKEEDFNKLSCLCRIFCSTKEKQDFLKALEKILTYIKQLQEIDTSDTPPCYTVLEELSNVLRQDNPEQPMPRDLFLSNASDHISGMIRVPSVLKQ